MGRQVNFLLLPEDLESVERAICSLGPTVFLPDVVSQPRTKIIASIEIRRDQMGAERLRVYATRPDFLSQIQFRYVVQQKHFIIEPRSPVIELDRCYFDGTKIRQGRMYFYTGPGINPEFIRWADKVLRAVRKVLIRLPELPTEYFGGAALEWKRRVRARAQPGLGLFAPSSFSGRRLAN